MRNSLEWTAIIGGLALAYPLVKSGGLLDQWLGGWWLFGAACLVGLIYAAGRLWDTWVDRRTCPPAAAAAPSGEAHLTAQWAPPGQTLH